MKSEAQEFYSLPSLPPTTENILSGRIVKINPALVTILDGLIDEISIEILQDKVWNSVISLMIHNRVFTFHLDINLVDYGGFGPNQPKVNTNIFTPFFLKKLNSEIRRRNCHLNVHFLTDYPLEHFKEYSHIGFGAICYQLDVIKDIVYHKQLISEITSRGACASPVIEVVGSKDVIPQCKEEVLSFIQPVLPSIGMLTFQVEATAARSNKTAGLVGELAVREYIKFFKQHFRETVQIQGGIKISTIAAAVNLGANFLVSGTQIFRNQEYTPEKVIEFMLMEAAKKIK